MLRIVIAATLTAMTTCVSATDLALPPAPIAGPARCSVTTAFATRPLFTNAGIFVSKSEAHTNELFCQRDEFYFDVWSLTPYERFGDGGEIDVRGGWTKTFGQFGVDASAAWYNFRIGGVGDLNSADARGKIFYNLDPAPWLILQVYGLADYQRVTDFFPTRDAFGVAVGVYASYKLATNVELGVASEVWQYTSHWTPNKKAEIVNVVPEIKYLLNKNITIFGKAAFTSGNIVDTGNGWKKSFQVGASLAF